MRMLPGSKKEEGAVLSNLIYFQIHQLHEPSSPFWAGSAWGADPFFCFFAVKQTMEEEEEVKVKEEEAAIAPTSAS